jgi:hypothetical protein
MVNANNTRNALLFCTTYEPSAFMFCVIGSNSNYNPILDNNFPDQEGIRPTVILAQVRSSWRPIRPALIARAQAFPWSNGFALESLTR